jgi:predicted DNA-binding ribbon-helix-helix protein
MLPNHQYPIPQREPLLRIVRNRRIHRPRKTKAPTPGVECRAGAKVSSLAVAGAGVCSPAHERYLIRQPDAPDQRLEYSGIDSGSSAPSWDRLEERGTMKSTVMKRSIVLAGHKTSVSLEDAFWEGLKDIAKIKRKTLPELVGVIDIDREHANLSSAIRLFVLNHYQAQAA